MLAWLSRVSVPSGVPVGAKRAKSVATSKPGRPASARVGTSGSWAVRWLAETPSALRRPPWMKGTAATSPSSVNSASPLSSASNPASAPLTSTLVTLISSMSAKRYYRIWAYQYLRRHC